MTQIHRNRARVAEGSLTAAAGAASKSTPVVLFGPFNLLIRGTFTATIKLERSFDNGVTWAVVSKDVSGTEASYTAAVNIVGEECEDGILYRLNCTAYTSGEAFYRLSQ